MTSNAGNLTERVYLVTGAAGGLGRAISRALAEAGATVILLDKEVAGLEAAYDEIETSGAPQPAILSLDLEGAEAEDYEQLVATVGEELGRLDGIVHAAAQLGGLAPIADYPPTVWTRVLAINLTGPYLITRACLPLLEEASDPTVVFVSDEVGEQGKAYWGAYGVSKAGMEALARMLADETEQSLLRIHTVIPGPMATHLQSEAFPGATPEEWPDPSERAPGFARLLADREGLGNHHRWQATEL